jgi:hypothetical protein
MCNIFLHITKKSRPNRTKYQQGRKVPTFAKLMQLCIFNLCFLLMLLSAAGCKSNDETSPLINYRYKNPAKDLTSIGRIAFLEMTNNTTYPEITNDLTGELFAAMQKKQIFGLTIIRQSDAAWKSLQMNTEAEYTFQEVQEIRSKLKCDGLLIGTITEFTPHPHTTVGLKMKLLDLRDNQLAWAIEQIWDSSDKTNEQQIKNYLKQQKHSDSSTMQAQLVKISPLEFYKFVSYEVAETLEKK